MTKTNRYFDGDEVRNRGCQYEKIMCEGNGSVPNRQQVQTFTDIIDKFIAKHPNEVVGVHCTHGYNRTGYLIVSYLITRLKFHVDDAIKAFSNGRPPGIYRETYVQDLVHRYGGDLSKHFIAKPFWVKNERNPRVIVPPEQLTAFSGHVIPVMNNLMSINVQRPINHQFGQSYEDQKRREANRKRWKEFDKKRREKIRVAKEDLRSHECQERFPYHESRGSRSRPSPYQRPSPYDRSSYRS